MTEDEIQKRAAAIALDARQFYIHPGADEWERGIAADVERAIREAVEAANDRAEKAEAEAETLRGQCLMWQAKMTRAEAERDKLRADVAAIDSLIKEWRTCDFAVIVAERDKLKAEVERLRDLVRRGLKTVPLALTCSHYHHAKPDQHGDDEPCQPKIRAAAWFDDARAALATQEPDNE